MKPTPALLLGIAFLATACGGVTSRAVGDYDRGAASEAKFKADADSCDKEAKAHQKEFGYGPYDPGKGPYNRMYDMCMQSNGYALKPKN